MDAEGRPVTEGVTPHFWLAVLEDALADPNRPRGRRGIVLEVRNAEVMGHHGTFLGIEDGKRVYGYSRAQCKAMKAAIRQVCIEIDAAAAEQQRRDAGIE